MIPAWLVTARAAIGAHEVSGSGDNPVIMGWPKAIARKFPEMASYAEEYKHDETAWCGLFVAYCLAANGIRPPFGGADTDRFLWANSYSRWGTKVDEPQPGDVAVFTRDGGGHVAFFERYVGDDIEVTGGNQSDCVSTIRKSPSQLTGFYRPPAPEKLPTAGNIPEWSSGKGSWYSQYQGQYSWIDKGDAPNSNALHVPDDQQGIALYDRSTLGKWFDVKAPNAKVLTLRQSDIGPHPRTGRSIDIAAVAAERFGYTPTNFPTDSIFQWRPAAVLTEPTPVPRIDPDDIADRVVKRIQAQTPEQKQAWGAVLTAALKAVQLAFPQFAVFAGFAQFVLASFGVMGMPGIESTTTGNVTSAGLATMFASWAISAINKVAAK